MRKSQNINFNVTGKASCLLLLVLTFLVVNPVGSGATYAYSDEASDDGDAGVSGSDTTSGVSLINFSFGEPVGITNLTPVSDDGASAKYSVKATVSVENSGGYTVYLGSDSSELVGKNYGEKIDAVSGTPAYEELPKNTWGYNAVEEGVEDPGTFQAIPTNNRGAAIGENKSNNIKSDEKTFTLSFATRIGNDKPADTYENEVTLSVVSSPLEIINDFSIATMQEMTPAVCAAATDINKDGQISAQLKDTRDGKFYWVGKLADGECWMTQNLDLDLSASKALTPEDSDVTNNWTPGFTTATEATKDTVNAGSQTEARSWSLGDYRIINPTENKDCGYPKNNLSQCATQFMTEATPTSANGDPNAHYVVGNHYQWSAATAETGRTITGGQAPGSICPKGWRLPESNTATISSFDSLLSAYAVVNGSTASVVKLTSDPLFFVRGGYVNQNLSNLFTLAGAYGYYWSSTPASNSASAYYLAFGSTSSIHPSTSDNRYYGLSVRCVAR